MHLYLQMKKTYAYVEVHLIPYSGKVSLVQIFI